MPKPSLIILTGPTAVGKSALALELARLLDTEIISADSRTIYRSMDIATAKPGPAELANVAHHLINVVNPDQEFNLPDFLEQATEIIENLEQKGKVPLVVGGTVLYINALAEGWQVPRVAPNLDLRRRLEEEAERRGPQALYEELKALDPAAAEHINPLNTRRIVRALEVYQTTGQLFSASQGKAAEPPYRTLKLGLTLEREKLYERADRRVDLMFEAGLVEEVRQLLAAGYSPALPAMSSVGYVQVIAYLNGEISLEEAKAQMKLTTHRYIRQQYSWFRRDPAIQWFSAADPDLTAKTYSLIEEFLAARD